MNNAADYAIEFLVQTLRALSNKGARTKAGRSEEVQLAAECHALAMR